jgi:hypothetical protein
MANGLPSRRRHWPCHDRPSQSRRTYAQALASSTSLGRHALVKYGSSGLSKRRSVNRPFFGSVWIQLPRSQCVDAIHSLANPEDPLRVLRLVNIQGWKRASAYLNGRRLQSLLRE